MSEPLSRVVLLAQLRFSASLCTAARSTGNRSQGFLIRLTEPRPKTWFGAVPTTTRLTTAMELLNGSLTNSCRTGPVAGVYGFMSTPSRGSTPKSRSSQLRLRSGSTVPARHAIEPPDRVFLDDGARSGDNAEHRPAASIRRRAEAGPPHRPRAQRAWHELGLRWHSHNVAVCQAADIDPANHGAGSPFERQPGRIQDSG